MPTTSSSPEKQRGAYDDNPFSAPESSVMPLQYLRVRSDDLLHQDAQTVTMHSQRTQP